MIGSFSRVDLHPAGLCTGAAVGTLAVVHLVFKHGNRVKNRIDRPQRTFDTKARTAMARGQSLSLTRKEAGLLEYLLLHQGQVISQEEMLEHLWDNSVNSFSNSIRVHISSLRKKLRAALGYDPIQNKIGQGYMMGGENP